MFEPLKNIFRRRCLKKFASQSPTGLIPLGSIRFATILLDRYDHELASAGRRLEEFFRNNSISVTILILDALHRDEVEEAELAQAESGKNCIGESQIGQIPDLENVVVIPRRRLNWFGRPKTKFFVDVIFGETDLLVNLSRSTDFPSVYISTVSRAKMKIGVVNYPQHPFDVVLTEESENGRRTNDKVGTILKFLKQII